MPMSIVACYILVATARVYTAYRVDDDAILTKILGAWQYLPAERSKVPWRQVVGLRGDRQNDPGCLMVAPSFLLIGSRLITYLGGPRAFKVIPSLNYK